MNTCYRQALGFHILHSAIFLSSEESAYGGERLRFPTGIRLGP